MTRYCEALGAGPDVVLVHGWGWHGGVWRPAAERLATRFRVWIPELPGHGNRRQVEVAGGLEDWMNAVRAQIPAAATWVGWSLGGAIALAAALARHATRLVLLGATPRFLRTDGWNCAWPDQTFARFRDDVERDVDAALERFAGLNAPAGAVPRTLLRRLRAEIFARGTPAPQGLRVGLDILRDTDLRSLLADVAVPTLVLHGAGDQIVNPQAAAHLARALPNARHVPVDVAGHALPLSHHAEIAAMIGEFAGG
ncbi:MAG TPA: alpha/beta fold hydrolase [Burkholderiales bacterium]|nr:alpha/beta fold hydrolase [Burkholderiales bacterium]